MIASFLVANVLGPLETKTITASDAICGLGILPDGTKTVSV